MPDWGAITIEELEPASWLVVATGVVALAAVALDDVWRWSRNVVTIVHEGGHALAAVLTGRRLTGIRLHSDTSGLTLSVGRPSGPGMVVTTAAGYLSPSLVGLVGVALLAADQVTVMLWGTAALLVAMLVMIRNVYGAFTLVLSGAVVVGLSLYASPDVQAGFGYAMTWFLLFGAVRPWASCGGSGARTRAATPTRPNWPASRTSPPACGWGSSAWPRGRRWRRVASCC